MRISCLPLVCVVCLVGSLHVDAAQRSTNRPNFVLFLVDDMGWQDTSVPFHDEVTPFNRRYRTPNMEKLAASGMKFTQAWKCARKRVPLEPLLAHVKGSHLMGRLDGSQAMLPGDREANKDVDCGRLRTDSTQTFD